MTEKQIGFLYKVASTLATVPKEVPRIQLLRSYYLMKCKEITKGYGLPQQQFSVKNRCPQCCLEWTKNTDTKVKSIHLSKRQRKRIKKNKSKNDLLHSNKLEQTCSFCNHSNVITVLKPKLVDCDRKEAPKEVETSKKKLKEPKNVIEKKEDQKGIDKNQILNAYVTSKDVFSLSNKNNTLPQTIKVQPKVVKNNKKKKDKFAGLCKQAVLASAKFKVEKEKPKNISLFLKPCS